MSMAITNQYSKKMEDNLSIRPICRYGFSNTICMHGLRSVSAQELGRRINKLKNVIDGTFAGGQNV